MVTKGAMIMCETYNGYANRETWALCLWLNNDRGLYESALDVAEQAIKEAVEAHDPCDDKRAVGDALRIYVTDDVFDRDGLHGHLRDMREEVGSLWRIDWDEVGSHFIPSEHGR